jgi:dolichol-phosphate mannosyltransferase
MNVLIVIPTYNERDNIASLIPEIFRVFGENAIRGSVLVVDDNSPDGTGDAVKALGNTYEVSLIARPGKLGLGSAYTEGFRTAFKTADVIFQMDADFSHDPKEIPNFIKGLKDSDVVVGSRYTAGGRTENWGISRKVISRAGNLIAKTFLGLRLNDVTTGYRAYRTPVLESIDLDSIKSNGYSFLVELLFYVSRKGFRIKETPIVFRDRTQGKSKLSQMEILYFFLTCWRLFVGERLIGALKK